MQKINNVNTTYLLFFVSALITVFVFEPLIFRGEIPVWSRDNISQSYVYINYSWKVLTGQEGNWIPYIRGGLDFENYLDNLSLSPVVLILSLITKNEQAFWYFFSYFQLINFFLLGIFFFLFSKLVSLNTHWSILGAIIFQLSHHTLYMFQTYPTPLVSLFFLIACCSILGSMNRNKPINLLVLTFSIVGIIVAGRPIYSVYHLMTLVIINSYFIYKNSNGKNIFVVSIPFIVSYLIAFLISLKYIIFFYSVIMGGEREPLINFNHFFEWYKLVKLVIPQLFGISYEYTKLIYEETKPMFAGGYGYGGAFVINEMFYSGAIASTLLFISLFNKKIKTINFWTLGFIFLFALLINFVPFKLISYYFFYPALHYAYLGLFNFFLVISFVLIMTKLEKLLDKDLIDLRKKIFKFFIFIVFLYFTIWSYKISSDENIFYFLKFLITLSVILIILNNFIPKIFKKINYKFLTKITLFSLLIFSIFLSYIYFFDFFNLIVHSTGVFKKLLFFNLSFIFLMIFFLIMLITNFEYISFNKSTIITFLAIILIPIFVGFFSNKVPYSIYDYNLSYKDEFGFSILSFIRLFLTLFLLSLAIKLLISSKQNTVLENKYKFIISIFIITFLELYPSFYNSSYFFHKPFAKIEKGNSLYPNPVFSNLDLKNYRVSNPAYMFPKSAIFDPEILKKKINIFLFHNRILLHGISSYMTISRVYDKIDTIFLNAFVTEKNARVEWGDTSYLSNKRYLDLIGVKYNFTEKGMEVRDKALSLFMFFTSIKVIDSNESALKQIVKSDFDPLKTLIISSKANLKFKTLDEKANVIKEWKRVKDNIIVKLEAKKSGILMFNSKFLDNWHVYVNGKNKNILKANVNFMGVELDEGSNEIEWVFKSHN